MCFCLLETYICNPTKDGSLFEKVGQFDDEVNDWGADANGMLWVCFYVRNVARLTMVTESSDTLENFEDEDLDCIRK